MSSYRRFKRNEDAISPRKTMSVHIGRMGDSLETLKAMCNTKCNEILKSVRLADGEEMEVVIWTDFELVGVAKITRNDSGLLVYSIDYAVGPV